MTDPPDRREPRPEDRPVDPDAVRRFEQLADPTVPGESQRSRSSLVRGPIRTSSTRNNLVTTAGGILIVVGAFVAVASVLAVASSDGLDLLGLELTGGAATSLFVGLAVIYVLTGMLVLLRRPIARPLGFAVGSLALLIGLAQLPSSGINAIPTIGVAVFVIYALAVGGNDFRRG